MPESIARMSNEPEEDTGHSQESVFPPEKARVPTEELLSRHKYQLRPRYQENALSSWDPERNRDMDSRGLEDHTRQKTSTALVVAIHEPSGQLVCIKGVQSSLQEHRILQLFTDHPGHSQNHCVPLLDVFQDPDDPEVTYMVMPYLHPINKPPFVTVGEVMDFVGQMLEGLDFLHTHGVAHRNGDISNVMMDANALLRRYHAMNADSNPTADHPAQILPRHRAGIRYYFVDFGLAMHVEHPRSVNKYVVGPCGKNRMVPEFSSSGPYDVFKADVYILGNLFREAFYKEYSNVEWLCPLIDMMTKVDPEDRPHAWQAEKFWSLNVASYRLDPSTVLIERMFKQTLWNSDLVRQALLSRPAVLGGRLLGWFAQQG